MNTAELLEICICQSSHVRSYIHMEWIWRYGTKYKMHMTNKERTENGAHRLENCLKAYIYFSAFQHDVNIMNFSTLV